MDARVQQTYYWSQSKSRWQLQLTNTNKHKNGNNSSDFTNNKLKFAEGVA